MRQNKYIWSKRLKAVPWKVAKIKLVSDFPLIAMLQNIVLMTCQSSGFRNIVGNKNAGHNQYHI